jgi:2-polyprenyl-3-methyl-5-hydroxy-6-metoxy-1,4-benzoquinol methylase
MGARASLVTVLAAGARALRAASSACAHAAAGAMRREALQHAIVRQWERYGRCTWSASTGLLEWEAEFYLPHLREGARVLVVGCGSGRDLLPIAARGHTVEGLDVAAVAVEACRLHLAERGLEARLRVGSIVDTTFEAAFDVVIFSWFCYSYVPESPARVRALVNAREALAPGGLTLLSYIPRAPRASRVPSSVAAAVARLTWSGWRPEHGDLFQLGGGLRQPAIEYEHRFAPAELEREAQAAGLRVVSHACGEDGRVVLARA